MPERWADRVMFSGTAGIDGHSGAHPIVMDIDGKLRYGTADGTVAGAVIDVDGPRSQDFAMSLVGSVVSGCALLTQPCYDEGSAGGGSAMQVHARGVVEVAGWTNVSLQARSVGGTGIAQVAVKVAYRCKHQGLQSSHCAQHAGSGGSNLQAHKVVQ